MSAIRNYLLYRDYKRNLVKAMPELKKYSFVKNYFNEFYTVLDLSDVPDINRDEFGRFWKEEEINKFLLTVLRTTSKYNIDEELSILEINEINEVSIGITFGIKPSIFKPRYFLYTKILSIVFIAITSLLILL